MNITDNLSQEVKRSIQIAQALAKENSNSNFSAAHLLLASLHKELPLRQYLENAGKDFYFMEDWAEVRIESYPKASKVETPTGDEKILQLFEEAENIRIKLAKDEIDLISILGSICTPGIAFSYDQLKTFPITISEIMSENLANNELTNALNTKKIDNKQKNVNSGALAKFCIDKTALARDGKLEQIIGRDKEVRMISEILGRRSKPNVIITGDPGVGKTAMVNGFVLLITEGKVPENIKNAHVFELETGAFIAGASYKGEAEDRMKSIINDIKQYEKAILFIDNIHTLLDKNGATPGLSNILKPELSKGDLTVIGITTNENYRKHIESDETFNRLFELLKIEEPDENTAARMLNITVPYFEQHHKVKLADGVVLESVRLAKRYMKERSLPDSAIDLIDRTMSAIKMMSETSAEGISSIEQELSKLQEQKIKLSEEDQLKELQWIAQLLKSKLSSVLLSQLENNTDELKLSTSEELQTHLNSILSKLKELSNIKRDTIEKTDLAAIVAHKTGIPLGKLQAQEKEKLMNMDELLKKRVVGQDHAVKAVCEAILESRSGLSKPGQPIGSFFLLGPTGTGKTELAKSLAEFLFNDENSIIRFDMSEFKEEHSAALLYGAPPGYVGYEEGGMLVNKIRQQPYAVVLFDEIEKAHPSVFDLFLQIMDEGKLHDRLGKEGDFSNAVILFTSNVGSDFIVESFGKKVIPSTTELMEIMTRYFRPEFLARLTEIVPFSPITEEIVLNIFQIQLNNFIKILNLQGIDLAVEAKAKEYLAKSGFTPKYGARPISGVIRNQIRRPLSKKIISGEIKKGDKVNLSIDSNNELIWSNQSF
ncbi:MAG: ATP-dependent Clp protease ATP-binding subunit [Bacteroidia bacterium]